MIELLTIWVALFGVCLWMIWRRDGSGTLILAYFIGLSIIHVPGAINYLSSDNMLEWREETMIGFGITLYGIAAFLVGVFLMKYLRNRSLLRESINIHLAEEKCTSVELIKYVPILFAIGLGAFFVGIPASAVIPSATSLIASLGSLIVISLWIYVFNTSRTAKKLRSSLYLSIVLVALPFSTLVLSGFAGFAIYWIIAVISMYFLVSRRRLILLTALPIVGWIGLSLGAAYFASRNDIRDSVWYQDSGATDRSAKVLAIFDNIRPYDVNDAEQVKYIDRRLNQNYLIGIGVILHRDGVTDLAYGGTVPLWIFIPRVVWPSKPAIGGGGNVVSNFTQIEFNQQTSVGAGQPLEFYANFGLPGVIFGFVIFGMIIAHHDFGLARGLRRQSMRDILYFGLPGIALLAPGNNIVEILTSFVSALIFARILAWVFSQKVDKQPVSRLPAE